MSKLQNVAPRVSINAFINPQNTIYCKTRSYKNIQTEAKKKKKLTWLWKRVCYQSAQAKPVQDIQYLNNLLYNLFIYL